MSNFYEFQNYKVIYKRYASLYFICLCDINENELVTLELIHHYVECLDKYFGNVCELDIIFNFHKAYYLLEEIVLSGYMQESSNWLINTADKKAIKRTIENIDSMLVEEKEEEYSVNSTISSSSTKK